MGESGLETATTVTEVNPTNMRERSVNEPTRTASRRFAGADFVREAVEELRSKPSSVGKKIRKSNTLHPFAHISIHLIASHPSLASDCSSGQHEFHVLTHMNIKQPHCRPICAIPSNAAAHAPPLTSLQHLTSALLAGRTSIFPIAAIDDSPPSRTHHGDRPSEERREMILMCCGRYETSIPTRMKAARKTVYGFGVVRWEQLDDQMDVVDITAMVVAGCRRRL